VIASILQHEIWRGRHPRLGAGSGKAAVRRPGTGFLHWLRERAEISKKPGAMPDQHGLNPPTTSSGGELAGAGPASNNFLETGLPGDGPGRREVQLLISEAANEEPPDHAQDRLRRLTPNEFTAATSPLCRRRFRQRTQEETLLPPRILGAPWSRSWPSCRNPSRTTCAAALARGAGACERVKDVTHTAPLAAQGRRPAGGCGPFQQGDLNLKRPAGSQRLECPRLLADCVWPGQHIRRARASNCTPAGGAWAACSERLWWRAAAAPPHLRELSPFCRASVAARCGCSLGELAVGKRVADSTVEVKAQDQLEAPPLALNAHLSAPVQR